jgi:H+/gluconate symporter-like permease
MKKILFYILSLVAIYLFLEIAKIIIYDFDRLTDYGIGYFVGKIILLFVSTFLAYILWKQNKVSKK